jgi:hypothetical protein
MVALNLAYETTGAQSFGILYYIEHRTMTSSPAARGILPAAAGRPAEHAAVEPSALLPSDSIYRQIELALHGRIPCCRACSARQLYRIPGGQLRNAREWRSMIVPGTMHRRKLCTALTK